ncbi:hypothetical protein ACIQTW_21565 [Paenarthrobacter sp. NPDC090517]|uniref:hypothetical protein n=1 Tax=Paenarthrobacter sp. NPDC090517 TaxID=3364381 RepID=UPI00381BF9CD
MGLRSLFRRKRAAAAPAQTTPGTGVVLTSQEPLSAEVLEELRDAWADLDAAASESGVKGIHACSRGGQPWQKDPAVVRTIATIIRGHLKDEPDGEFKTES